MELNKQVLVLDEPVTEKLLEAISKAYNTNLLDILLSALSLTIRDWTNGENTLVSLISQGRDEQLTMMDIRRTVGRFDFQFPVVLKACDDLRNTILYTKEMLRRVPDQGMSYGILKYISNENFIDVLPEIAFHYSDNRAHLAVEDIVEMKVAGDKTFVSKQPFGTYALEFEVVLLHEQLTITIGYQQDEFEAGTVDKLMFTYQEHLIRMIQHCAAKENTEITVTDITQESITMEQLYKYKDKLNNIKNIYPLGPMQEGMLYHALTEEQDMYMNLSCFQVEGHLDLEALDRAYDLVVKRHDILRTVFDYSSFSQNMQVVYKSRKAAIEYIDITNHSDDKKAYLDQLINQFRNMRFDLSKDNLFRIVFVRLEGDKYSVISHMHHILMDGWCSSLILIEFFKIYNELKHGIQTNLNEAVPYQSYINWIKNKDIEESKNYWRGYLHEFKDITKLPFKIEKECKLDDINIIKQELILDEQKTFNLMRIARQCKVTINTVIQSIWAILLSKYNNTNDIVYGYVVSGRNVEIKDVEIIPGLFINTIPLRVKFNEKQQYQDLLNRISETTLQNNRHDYVGLAEIQNLSEVKNSLISSLLVFENYPFDEKQLNEEISKNNDLKIINSVLELPLQFIDATNYDLTLVVNQDDNISFNFIYNDNVYPGDGIAKIVEGFEGLVDQIIENSHLCVEEIEIINDCEKTKIIHEFNPMRTHYSHQKSIVQLFEEQVDRLPHHTALIYKNITVSYRELNERANRLAHYLMRKGIGNHVLVGIMGERSIDMVTGILGILKAGGAYLPVDSNYPVERINMLLDESNTTVLMVQSSHLNEIKHIDQQIDIVKMDQIHKELSREGSDNPGRSTDSSDLAYVMFTSGSTGKPKGVMVEHRSVVRLVNNTNYIDWSENDRILQTGAMAFDASTFEIWGALLNGNVLVLAEEHTLLSTEQLGREIRNNGITTMWLTSPLFNQLVQQDLTIFTGLKTLIVGGDVLSWEHINQVRNAHPHLKLINGYGPTENTTFSTYYVIEEQFNRPIPIGKAISNSKAYIMDRHNHLQPIGVAGELCVAGDGLARGYLNNVELTAEKFVENPFESGTLMYKTGDLARFLPDGNIEYLGRMDEQVKIRGFRIEPNEIAQQLLLYKGIRDAIVVAQTNEDRQTYLCAYLVSEMEISVSELRDYLVALLPSYMVPSYFIQMDRLPLTLNGKVDQKSLPKPNGEIYTGAMYAAPRNEMEQDIVEVWEKILGINKVGIEDNFFALGGDSIKAIQAVAQMNNKGYAFNIKDLMDNGTIKFLVPHLKQTRKNIDQSNVMGEIELTPIQLWFIEQDLLKKDYFNQDLMLFRRDGFREDRIEHAFSRIVQHHDVLRGIFVDGKFINREVDSNLYDLNIYDFRGEPIEDDFITSLCTELQASMKLAKGPLVKLGLFKTDHGDHLLISIHHMVVDTVSWRIIIEDFDSLYSGQEQTIPIKTTSFQEWAFVQKKYSTGAALKSELKYWNRLSQWKIKKLKKDMEPKSVVGSKLINKTIVLDKLYTENLLTKVNKAYSTDINDILLSALTLTIGSFNETDRIMINLESHGREHIVDDVDITRTVGWFTSQYPIVLHTKDNLSALIKSTKDTMRRIPGRGIGYGILKYLSPFELEQIAQPEIAFNYLGQFDESISGENFTLSDISTGTSVSKESSRLHPLSISGMVLHKELSLTLSYIREEYKDETVNELMKHFIANLKTIIDHCISRKHVEVTASDLTDEDISMDDLNPYMEQIENIKRIYPLTPMQEGMLYHSMADHDESYHVNMELRVSGELDVTLFSNSFQELVSRHDVLRTGFDSTSFNENMQVVYKSREAEFQYVDIMSLQTDKEAYIERLVMEDRRRGFDLLKDPLIRMFVIRLEEHKYSLLLSNHHIILDGWSFGIISGELFDIYSSLLLDVVPEEKKLNSYGEYIKWISLQDKAEALNYWATYLNGYDNTIEIPFKKNSVTQGKPQEVVLTLDSSVTKTIEAIAKSNNVTINTIFQSVWAIQLQRYNNVNDVVFGYIVSGRTTQINGIDEMVGLFINAVPLRVNTTHEKSYTKLLQRIKADFNESEAYQYCPIVEVQKFTEVGTGLINGLMVFENYPIDQDMINKENQGQVNLSIGSSRIFEETNYDFNIKVIPEGEQLVVKFDYNDGIYDEEKVLKIKNHFLNILNQIIANQDIRIDEIDIVTLDERNELLADFNDTCTDYDVEHTIQDLFDYQVMNNPEKQAVIFGKDSISYGELDKKANVVAKILRDKGIGVKSIVPIMIGRSIDMIVGVLAILKAGAAYLPIDENYPKDRINYILQDSKAEIMLSTQRLVKLKSLEFKEIVDIEDKRIYKQATERIDNMNGSNDLAYVIYTSGTTGKPKGVMVEHKGVVNLKHWFERDLGIGKDEQILQFASFSFDAFSWELFMTILLGNTLCIPDKDVLLSPDSLNEFMITHAITTITIPPFVAAEIEAGAKLRRVITAGSELRYEQISHLLEKVEVINAYGPTEDTVCTTTCKLSHDDNMKITIGTPISNHQVLVLDINNKLVPKGVNGELCIAGIGLARGYLNNETLTKQKFIKNPYQQNGVIYKTGDVVRWTPNGSIEYVGRADHQVKIRGHRIEIGEIEQSMLQLPEVSQIAVVDKEMNDAKCLCAYYVSEKEIAIQVIREALAKELPAYMIPAYFIRMDSLPFNLNGKVDRNSLPELQGVIATGVQYEEAQNEVESLMISICKNVLGLTELGVRDNLFEVGGDSIRIAKIHKELAKVNIYISIKDFFYYENVRDIYKNWAFEGAGDESEQVIEGATLDFSHWEQEITDQLNAFSSALLNNNKVLKVYPLSAMQKIMLKTNKTYSGSIIEFNQKINVQLLKQSICRVINDQGLLRSVLIKANHRVMIQEYDAVNSIDIPYVNMDFASGEQKERIQAYIDELYGENAVSVHEYNKLLYKIIIIKYSESSYKVYMPCNHIIFDAMSSEIIEASIKKAYLNDSKQWTQQPLQYDHYVNEILGGPQGITEKELIERFHLDHFHSSFIQYMEKFEVGSLINTTISIPLTSEIIESLEEKSWEISLEIFLKVLELNFELETVPFALMHTGRKYNSNNYYNTVGAFIDILPLSLPCDSEYPAYEEINELISLAYAHNINFAALLTEGELKKKYKKINRTMNNMLTSETINIPVFNYMGLYSSHAEMKEEISGMKEKYVGDQDKLSTEIIIGRHGDELKVKLFCNEDKIVKITKEIQRYINSTTKLLST